MSSTQSIFVYGTLKQGSLRASLWPFAPQRIVVAEIQGELYDLGPYPAACDGDGRIGGERWDFLPDQMADTLALLDRIEGYGQDAENLYERRLVESWDEAGRAVPSFAYYFANRSWALRHPRVPPNDDGLSIWFAPSDAQPVNEVDE